MLGAGRFCRGPGERRWPRTGRPVAGEPAPVGCHAFAVPVEPRPRHGAPAGRYSLAAHTAPAAACPPRTTGAGRCGEAAVVRRRGRLPGGRPSPARSWRSSSEAAWLDTPSRARSASRVIGWPCWSWCSAAARRAAVRSASSPPSCGLVPGILHRGRPSRRGRLADGAVLARDEAGAAGGAALDHRDRHQERGRRDGGHDPAPGRRLGLGQVGRQAQQHAAREHHGRPRQPPGDDALLLVALPLAGGHHAGQVDADRHRPGHRAALAVLGGGVADVSERPRPGDHREHGDGQRVGDREQAAARAHQPSGRPARPGRPGGPSPPYLASCPLAPAARIGCQDAS